MRLIVGMMSFVAGYALLYYGVVLYREYVPANPSATNGIPFSALLGFKPNVSSLGTMWVHPPFTYAPSATTSGTATPAAAPPPNVVPFAPVGVQVT